MSDATKPRIRVPARSSGYTADSFQNFSASLGYGTSNLSSGSSYGFNPVSRNHVLIEWMYRGSWLVKQVVDAPADDMTREGISIESDMSPDDIDTIHEYFNQRLIWQRINETIKWSRLYGGALAVIMVNGQKTETPLNVDSISKDQFEGLIVFDRWMLNPSLQDPVTEMGPDFGKPRFYDVVTDAEGHRKMRIHHSRCIRIEGIDLPYWQRMAENGWGLSIIEPLYDRLIAFDSTTQGAAQLVYRAHLRTLKIEKLRELIAFGGEAYNAVLEQIKMIRLMQANESITVLDATDDFQTYQYAFGGLSDVMVQFAQQLSGAAQIPLVRLFGQSPAGLNATGDADIRNYYDAINAAQETRLRRPMTVLLDVIHRSLFGRPLPKGFNFQFSPLWQMTDAEKTGMATQVTQAVGGAFSEGLVSAPIALKELRQSSKITGIWSNITDEDIKEAENLPPPGMEQGAGAGAPGEQPGEAAPEADDEAPGLTPEQRERIFRLLPAGKKPDPAHIKERGHIGRHYMQTPEDVAKVYSRDQMPMMEVHGIPITIEAEKGQRRENNSNWPPLPAHYGFINATASEEGPLEGLDCYVGPDEASEAVWIIEQNDPRTGAFDELKFMLAFPDRDAAVSAYQGAFGDADDRIGAIRRTSIAGLKKIIAEWPVGRAINGSGKPML